MVDRMVDLVAVFMVVFGDGYLVFGIWLTWKMGADQRSEDSLDQKLPGRNEIGIEWILGTKEGNTSLHEVALQCDLAIDQGSDDIPVPGFGMLQDHDIAIQDPGTDHRITPHLKCEGFGIARDLDRLGVDRDAAIHLLLLALGNTGGNHPIKGHFEKFRTGLQKLTIGKDDIPRTPCLATNSTLLFHEVQMASHRSRRAKSKTGHDLTN